MRTQLKLKNHSQDASKQKDFETFSFEEFKKKKMEETNKKPKIPITTFTCLG